MSCPDHGATTITETFAKLRSVPLKPAMSCSSARSEGIGPAEAVDSRDPAASFARPRSAPRRRSLRAGLLGNFAFRGAREHDWKSQMLVRDASELTGFELLYGYQQVQLDLPA